MVYNNYSNDVQKQIVRNLNVADEKDLIENEDLDELEYEPTIIELEGEKFEVIDAIEYNGKNYVAVVEYEEDADENSDVTEFMILEEIQNEEGEYFLSTIEEDSLYDEIGEAFTKHFDEMFSDIDGLIQ